MWTFFYDCVIIVSPLLWRDHHDYLVVKLVIIMGGAHSFSDNFVN